MGDHPDTAASLHMLACCYHKLGDTHSLDIARYANGFHHAYQNLVSPKLTGMFRCLLQDALRILESQPSPVDKTRIGRTLFKLSLVWPTQRRVRSAI